MAALKRLAAAAAAVAALGGTAFAAEPDLQLRGDRFRPLTYGELTPAQKTMADNILAGSRGRLNGPYNVLLRSPEMGDLAQKFGEHTRYRASTGLKMNEFVILLVARYWTSQYVWQAHHANALAAGLSPALIAAVREDRRPEGMSEAESAVHDFVTELLRTKAVGDATFDRAKAAIGEQGIVDTIATMGYYKLVSMLLNVDRYPLEPGREPELRALAAR